MTCSRCSADRQPDHFGSPRGCAFEAAEFSGENWNCGTMNVLRDSAVWSARDDNQNESIGVVPLPENDVQSGYIVLGFYKERGQTGSAVVVCGTDAPKPLTLEIARLVAS